MRLSKQDKQLIKVAGSLNLLFFLLCLVFVLYSGHGRSEHNDLINKAIRFTLGSGVCWVINLFLLLIVYPVAPKWRYSRWLFFYLPSYLITCGLAIPIAAFVVHNMMTGEDMESPVWGPINIVFGLNSLSLVAIELILSRLAQASIKMEHANMQMELARLNMKSMEAQHEKLKNQLHPHFLFNSLTALKSLIRKDPLQAENYLIKLAFFLRFSMSHNEQNVVQLQEELKFSLYYLEMQKTRFRDALTYSTELPAAMLENALLPVFSLQLVIENAIKHNSFTQERPLNIIMRYLDSDWLMIENNIQEKLHADPSSGIGLRNLSDRYKLLANDDIVIENDSLFFRVYLKVIRP